MSRKTKSPKLNFIADLPPLEQMAAFIYGDAFAINPAAFEFVMRYGELLADIAATPEKQAKIFRSAPRRSIAGRAKRLVGYIAEVVADCVKKKDGDPLRRLAELVELDTAKHKAIHAERAWFELWLRVHCKEAITATRPAKVGFSFSDIWKDYVRDTDADFQVEPEVLRRMIRTRGFVLKPDKRGAPRGKRNK